MADVILGTHQSVPDGLKFTYKDMGDGTWAQVYALGAGTANIGDVDIDSAVFAAADTGPTPAQAVLIGGDDGTNIQSIACTTTKHLEINVADALPAGENHVGEVGGATTVKAVTPTVTAGAYVAKEAVGGRLEFANAVRVAAGSGTIHAVTIIDNASQSAELVLVLFNQAFTATNDNAAFDPSDADLLNCIGKIVVAATDYNAFADNAVACKMGIGLPFELASGTTLYGQLMCTGTPTYAATSDVTVKVHILQD